MTDLDELLSGFTQRKQAELAAAPPKDVAAERLRAISHHALQTQIAPILQDLAATIRAGGQDASVKESFTNTAYPAVLFSFTPIVPIRSATIASSSIRFTHTATGALEIAQVIGTKARRQSLPTTAILPSTISDDLIRSEVIAFVSAVLNAN
jgi:hypothetical protein